MLANRLMSTQQVFNRRATPQRITTNRFVDLNGLEKECELPLIHTERIILLSSVAIV